jgi:hypothetical protein
MDAPTPVINGMMIMIATVASDFRITDYTHLDILVIFSLNYSIGY